MSLSLLLLFLHIVVIFAAITLAFGSGLLERIAYMTGQVGVVRGVGIVSARVGPAIPIVFVSGGLLGLLAAISFGFDLLAPWLLIAYVLFALAAYIGAVENRKWAMQLGQLLAKTPDGPLTPELAAMFTDRRVLVVTAVNYVLLLALIFDMVVKPFS